ncbi:MAG: hypothetical protein WD076_06040 [Parvularculaceae bacterium]
MPKLILPAKAGRALKAALFASAASALGFGALAEVGTPSPPLRMKSDYFGYSAAMSPRVGYSDNINLAPDGLKENSFTASNLFSGAAIYSSKRFTGLLSGDLDVSYISEVEDIVLNQRVGAASTFTVFDNAFYIDAAGSSSRQLLGENARFSQNLNAARGQRADVHTVSVSPYLFRQFADESSAQLRFRYSKVFIDDDNAGANPFGGNFLNDSRTEEVLGAYDSGLAFDRFRFTGTVFGNKTIEDGSVVFPRIESRQRYVSSQMQFALSSNFGLSGTVGYDDIETDITPSFFNDDELSGVFWRAGFYANPGPRTSIRAEYGRRFGDDFVDASLTYKLSSRYAFSAGASQAFETRSQSFGSQFFERQRSTLEFADRLREGAELSPNAVIAAANRFSDVGIYAQTTGIGVVKSAYAQLSGAYDRTEISATANYQDTNYGYREIQAFTGVLNARRKLSRRVSAYGGMFYRWSETTVDQATCQASPFIFGFDVNAPMFDPVQTCLDFAFQNGETNTIGGRIGGAYRLYENVSAFVEYARTTRFADSPLLEYSENAVVGGVTLEF